MTQEKASLSEGVKGGGDVQAEPAEDAAPSYTPPPPGYSQTPPDLHLILDNLNLEDENAAKPTVDECIAHLKLLEAFYKLRETVSHTDGLFGIYDNLAPQAGDEKLRGPALAKIAEKRWSIYVARAADRFERWWDACVPASISGRTFPDPLAARLREEQLSPVSQFEKFPTLGARLKYSPDNLPPLDVLMVWHAYMLNPRNFFEDCVRFGKMDFWETGMPWEAVDSCIDSTSFTYTPSNAAIELFASRTSLAWDNLQDGPTKVFACPKCSTQVACLWTSWDRIRRPEDDPREDLTARFDTEALAGFAERSFTSTCPSCRLIFSHDILRLRKFGRDLQLLLRENIVMPGTILSRSGMPESASRVFGLATHPPLFPNRLLKADSVRGKLAALVDFAGTDANLMSIRTMNSVKNIISLALEDRKLCRQVSGRAVTKLAYKTERLAVRRMMSRYWDNSSVFALDLVGAVIRQGAFVEKMHQIDWLHSPALSVTIERLRVKYGRFFQIMTANPGKVAVPTLDVDLAWHTHQLSPPFYFTYSALTTRIFVDHDDKIVESDLSTYFEWTSKEYQKLFNEVYSECSCFYCESVRASHSNPISSLFKSSSSDPWEIFHNSSPAAKLDPSKTAHISAHSAVSPRDVKSSISKSDKSAQLATAYEKACKRARKKGRKEPVRDDYYWAWGYPMFFPVYYPYMADPCISNQSYACNPACMALTPGVPGNCANGSCGGAAAAGSCGSFAMGGCGGAGGACAGGGGGGGGCGGGGGGCGGGGGGGCGGGGC
ncbi:hypothetical protein L228DRAFT_245470 [Xylona heveae TC161]|uniref:Alpha-ketoglutarate-dependent sulfonate dioxygenase n=1 Tax=Xylona heveae (strain CBS 132557 / TC161) TaxID=1328760 RepID=A0A165I7W7_XYLHT|nr:hypothetical protein L228DRAFT_245470 [Xylona heveae TC161]KZF24514.1 hypothetical protein L228DRAFT_245470 [Xylona heveae TC161]